MNYVFRIVSNFSSKDFFFLRAVVVSRKNSFSCLGEVCVGKLRFLSSKKMLCFGLYDDPEHLLYHAKMLEEGNLLNQLKLGK